MQLLLNENNYLDYIDVNAEIHFDTLNRFIKKATHEFLLDPIFGIGKPLYDELATATTPTAPQEELLDLLRTALGDYTMKCFIPKHSVEVSGAGIAVIKSDKTSPASDAKIKGLVNEYKEGADSFLEKAFEYLEENASDFPTWKSSDSYTIRTELFVSSVNQFKQIISSVKTRIQYMKMRAYLSQAETTLFGVELGATLIKTLKTQINGNTLEDKYIDIVSNIRIATANHAFAHYLSLQENKNETAIKECRSVMQQAFIAVTDTFKSDQSTYPDYPHHVDDYKRIVGNDEGEHDSQFVTF